MVGWGAEAPTSINNDSMAGCAVPDAWHALALTLTLTSQHIKTLTPHRKGPLIGQKIDLNRRRPPFAEAGGNPWPIRIRPRAGHWGVKDYPWAHMRMGSVVCVYGHSTEKETKSGKSGLKNNLGGDIFLVTTSDPPHSQPKVSDNNNTRGDIDQDGEGGGGEIAHPPPAGSHLVGGKNRYNKVYFGMSRAGVDGREGDASRTQVHSTKRQGREFTQQGKAGERSFCN